MIDGFFRIAFTGKVGSGFGLLVFRQGVIAGADTAGAVYNGTYTQSATSQITPFEVIMDAPAGVTPVQTGIPLAAPMRLPIKGEINSSKLNGADPILLQTPIGPVNVIFKKIRDIE